jgi:hypothetical protein
MLKRGVLLAMLFAVSLQASATHRKRPRYIFVLPNGYVGWVQIIFNDPAASKLPMRDGGYEIDIPESGISRSSDLRVEDFKSPGDEFYYRSPGNGGPAEVVPVPSEYVMPGVSHGGFSGMGTGGRGKGYSWFIFIGPPSLRSKVPLADWDKVVEAWWKLYGNRRVSAPDVDPTPGRMSSSASTQQ